MIQVAGIRLYPVKSLHGIEAAASELDDFGLRHDRRWVIVDAAGRFHTQRWRPRLALIRTRIAGGGVELSAPGWPVMPVPPGGQGPLDVTVWRDRCVAEACSAEADRWISDFLGEPCRFAWMAPDTARATLRRREESLGRIGFADAYPLLAISEASLAGLNGRLESPVPMNRFRPNLIISGVGPHAEDDWDHVRIGSIDMVAAKPCERCVLTTIDQETGVAGLEPLRTLATYRRRGPNVIFGVYLAHSAVGTVRVGDEVVPA